MKTPLVVFVRHAESEGNVLSKNERANFAKSTWEYALTNVGKTQAEKTGIYLKNTYGFFDAYYSSYYTRTIETMKIMYSGVSPIIESRLAEAQRGIYHILSQDEVIARYPEELTRKNREGLYHYRPPGGENWLDVEIRVHSFLNDLRREHTKQQILCSVHGHWLILFEKIIQKFSIEESLRRYESSQPENASITIYQWDKENLNFLQYLVPWK